MSSLNAYSGVYTGFRCRVPCCLLVCAGMMGAVDASWLDAHPDARAVVGTFFATDDPAASQGWEDTSALLRLILPAECFAGCCEHWPHGRA